MKPLVLVLGVATAWVSIAFAQGVADSQGNADQQTFDTPKAAVDSLLAACKDNDSAALVRMFGPRYRQAIDKIDDAEEKEHRHKFWQQAQSHLNLVEKGDDRVELIVGDDPWSFPIPLVKESRGWVFATDEGFIELLARRIGENELTAIEVCREYAKAQREYAEMDRDGDGVPEYAQRIASTLGQHDGLYWEAKAASGEPPSPLGSLLAEADGTPKERKPGAPYMGYYFRILTRQGSNPPGGSYDYIINGNMIAGFALVAWPEEYRASGVMTFLVSHHGSVWEKDLGPQTTSLAASINALDPDDTWTVVP